MQIFYFTDSGMYQYGEKMGKDRTPHTFSRPSGYESDLEISEKNAYKVNTSFGSNCHNAYAINKDGTHEHYYYDPQKMRSGWHGANFATHNNHPVQQTVSFGKETNAMELLTQRIDMRPETQEEIKNKYETGVKHVGNFTKNMIEQLIEKSEKHHSVKLKEAINYFIKFYNISLRGIVQSAVEDWMESETSVCEVLFQTGNDADDSLNDGKEFEHKLYETASSIFSGRLDELSHSTAGGFFGAQDLEECAEIVQRFLDKFDELIRETKDEFETKAETNAIYSAVESLVLDTMTLVFASYEEAQKQFNRLCEDLRVIIPQRHKIGIERSMGVMAKTDRLSGHYEQHGISSLGNHR